MADRNNPLIAYSDDVPRAADASAADEVDAIRLSDVVDSLRHWWWLALPCGVLLAAVSGAAVWAAFKPTYQAAAWLQIEDRRPYVAFPAWEGESKLFAETQVELIRSPLVLSRVLSQPEIARLPEVRASADGALEWLSKKVSVKSVGKSELFQIMFAGKNPEHAAMIANAVVDRYLELQSETSARHADKIIRLLREEKERRANELEQMQDRVRRLAEGLSGPVVSPGAKTVVAVQDPLTAIQEELGAVEVEREFLEAELEAHRQAAADDRETTDVPTSVVEKALENRPDIVQVRGEIAAKQAKLAAYQRTSARGAADPGIRRLQREIEAAETSLQKTRQDLRAVVQAELRQQLKQSRQENVDRTEASLKSQRLLEKLLKERLAKQREQLKGTGGRSLEFEFARSELERAEVVFQRIAERIVALSTEQRAPPQVTLLERAIAPAEPSAVPYSKLALACLGGFCLPFGLAVVAERRLRRIAEPRQICRETNLQVMGEITTLPTRSLLPSRRAAHRFARHCSTFQESIENLGTNLSLLAKLQQLQVVVVASAASREGKTSVASQLAISLANSSQEPTLLIDADLRAPDLHRRFETSLAPGLVDVLSGAVSPDEAIVHDLGSHLHLLTAGRLDQSPHGLLGKGAFRALLDSLRPHYRTIVIDGPPVLAASEALFVAREADGTLLCAMRDVSRAHQVKLACERLRAAGARPLGAVLSGVPMQRYTRTYGSYEAYLRQSSTPVGWRQSPSTEPPPTVEVIRTDSLAADADR
ncbi:MAG TPA: hypothetical protein VJ783_17205 [Pirellulales bacterium]|nr:hypothetical protein [Pirellulales bacterium]